MNNQLISSTSSENKNLYKFESAKKIYFARTTSKCFLIEKKIMIKNALVYYLVIHSFII